MSVGDTLSDTLYRNVPHRYRSRSNCRYATIRSARKCPLSEFRQRSLGVLGPCRRLYKPPPSLRPHKSHANLAVSRSLCRTCCLLKLVERVRPHSGPSRPTIRDQTALRSGLPTRRISPHARVLLPSRRRDSESQIGRLRQIL